MLKPIFFALLLAVSAQAEVIETNKYEDVFKYVTADTLFVTDLDNTVIRPPQTLGSDQWGSAQMKRFREIGFPPAEATDLGVGMFALLQLKTSVIPVEGDIPQILSQIAAKGVRTLGLTARPLAVVDRTLDQVKSIGASLTGVTQTHPSIAFGGDSVAYKGGVLFVGAHNNKGEVLKKFLENNPMPNIKRIVFIDDKAHHTADVDAAFKDSTIEVKALRYGGADPQVSSYDANLAKVQWEHFLTTGVIIPDPQ